MNRKFNVLVLATSAPHFPIKNAKESYLKCLRAMKDKFRSEFNFFEFNKVVTDTVSLESDLRKLKRHDPDILILIQGAFTWDNITVWLHEYFRKIPTILWALPEGNYSKGVLGSNSLCGAIMNNATFRKLGIYNLFCYGHPQKATIINQIGKTLKIIACAIRIKSARYGMIGYRPTGFYNSCFDEIRIRKELGIETVYYDLASLFKDMEHIPKENIKKDINAVKYLGKIREATKESLASGARIYLALKEFIRKEKIDFLAVQCWPEMMRRALNPCMVLGRLIEEKIAAGCESDFGGALSMAIASWISGEACWLADLIDINKRRHSLYFWHCGAAPRSLASLKESPVINKQFRGLDRCNTLEFALKKGSVTVLRFGITNDRFRIFAFEGKAILPAIKIRGNLSEIIPDQAPERVLSNIIENEVEHHFAIIYNRCLKDLRDIVGLLGIDFYSV